MKHFWLVLVILVLGQFGLLAQISVQTPYFNTFDVPDTLWTTTGINTIWQKGTPAYGATNSAHSAPNAWDVNLTTACGSSANCKLMSPQFSFTGVSGAILSCWINYKCESGYDGVRLEYSLNGINWGTLGIVNDPLATNWYNYVLATTNAPGWTGNSQGWKKCTFNLNLFDNAPSVYFRFIYNSDNSGNSDGFSMDDFRIGAPLQQSVTMKSILSPNSACSLGNETVSIKFKNTGLAAITGGLTAGYRLGNFPVVVEPIPGVLAAGDSLSYTFTWQVNFPVSLSDSTYSFKAWANLAGDPDHTDDTLSKFIISKKTPDLPQVNNQNINFGTSATLNAISSFPVNWFDVPVGGNLLSTLPTYHTPIIYCNTVYYVDATGPSGCKSARVPDSIFILNAPINDGITLNLVAPANLYGLTNHEIIKVNFNNPGCQAFANFTVSYSINGGSAVNENVAQPISPFSIFLYSFYTPADFSALGTYIVKIWITVPGDINHTNDTITVNVLHLQAYYCNSAANAAFDDLDIGNVNISNLNNGNAYPPTFNITSTHNYSSFLTSVAPIQLNRGQSYTISISPIWQSNAYVASVKVFVDWDQNSLFDPATETAFTKGVNQILPFTGVITVPATAPLGDTRFRIVMVNTYDTAGILACGSYSYGETEDYTATISNSPTAIDAALLSINQPPSFYHNGDPFSPELLIKNNGSSPIYNLNVSYRIDNGPWVNNSYIGNITAGSITSYFFPAINAPAGSHILKAFISLAGDTDHTNDTIYKNIEGIPTYSIPYFDPFESTNYPYTSTSLYPGTTWIKGSTQTGLFPLNGAHSTPNVWATNLGTGSYTANARCDLATPDYQLVNGYSPLLSFWFTTKTDTLADGFHVEYSYDHGNSWAILGNVGGTFGWNWYPSLLSSNDQGGWSGNRPWTQAIYYFIGAPNPNGTIRFRFIFTSDASGSTGGVAIDDFKIVMTPSSDPGITNIIYPHQPLLAGGTSFVKFKFVNFGINTQFLLPASYQVNNGPVISQNFSSTTGIQTMQSMECTFSNTFIIPTGDFIVKVYIQEPLDQNHSNDTLVYHYHGYYPCQSVSVRPDTALFSPAIGNSNTLYGCPNSSFHVAATGIYPQNNLQYAQHDSTSLFTWDFGDGSIQFGKEINHIYLSSGTYRIRMKIRDVNNCESSFIDGPLAIVATSTVAALHPATPLCSNHQNTITIGYSDTNNIKLKSQLGEVFLQQQLSFDSAAYIPDGGGSSGNCYSYSTYLNLFNPAAVISQASDISSVCINMEHSYMGDLGITLTCPNGQTANLKSYNASGPAFLGIPLGGTNHSQYDCTSPPSCLLDPAQNPPGTGWDYCFTMSANHAVLNNYSSTNGSIASGNYLPNQSFTSLVGCPLNGNWTIKVCDNYNTDNGWVFNWKINLNPSILPDLGYLEPALDTVIWSGPNIVQADNNHLIVQPPIGGTYSYQVSITNSLGCSYDTSFTVSAFENFQVDCGPDLNLPQAAFATLSAHQTGAVLPVSYLWNTGATTPDITVSPYVTTSYRAIVIDATGCSASDSITINIGDCPNLNGHIYYDNQAMTPIINTSLGLQLNNITVSNTNTNNGGDYTFSNICQPGIYNIIPNCTLPNGGYNAADALKVVNYFVGNVTFDNIQKKAADVDLSSVINAADALQIMKRFVGLSNSFPAGDWVFENDLVSIGQYFNVTKNIKGLCTGDVDQSFTPGLKLDPAIELVWSDQILNVSIDTTFELPVYADVSENYYALSLIMNYNKDQIEIQDLLPNPKLVDGGQTAFMYNLINNELRIAWYSLAEVSIPTQEPLFTLRVKVKYVAPLSLSVSSNSSFANANGITIDNARLLIPKVIIAQQDKSFSVFPNPADESIYVNYSLSSKSEVSLNLYNNLGQKAILTRSASLQAGNYSEPISISGLNPGTYSIQIGIQDRNGYSTRSLLLIIQ